MADADVLAAALDAPAVSESDAVEHSLDRLIGQIIAPYVEPAADPQQAVLVEAVDKSIADGLRSVLHHPDFQELEANWRGLFFLLRNLDVGSRLKLSVLDATHEELVTDFKAGKDGGFLQHVIAEPEETGRARVTLALVCGAVSPTLENVQFLNGLAQIGAAAGVPVVSSASAEFVGINSWPAAGSSADWTSRPDDVQAAWESLRDQPHAKFLGVTLPRILMRRTHEAEDVESIQFTEIEGQPHRSQLLWASGVFALGRIIGQAFNRADWSFRNHVDSELTGLPVHVYEADGESKAVPCGEFELTFSMMESLTEDGFIPLLSIRGQDAIRVGPLLAVSRSREQL